MQARRIDMVDVIEALMLKANVNTPSRMTKLEIAGAILFLALLAGCDMGTYGKRVAERKEQLEQESRLASLIRPDEYVAIKDAAGNLTGFQIREPVIFVKGEGVLDHSIRGADPNRLLPPGIRIPGASETHESFQQNLEGILVAFYTYRGAIPATAEVTQDTVKAQIDELILGVLPDATPRWETVELPTTNGQTVSWQRMKLIAGQDFAWYSPDEGVIKYRQWDGHMVFGIYSTSNYHIVVAWRVPAEINDTINFLESADASMGSIRETPSS